MSDFLSNIIPLIIIVMIFRGILKTILGNNKHHDKNIPPMNDDVVLPKTETSNPQNGSIDLAAEFEKRLRQKEKAKNAQKDFPQVKEQSSRQYIHRDDESLIHDTKGKICYDSTVVHDGNRVYQEYLNKYSNNAKSDDNKIKNLAFDELPSKTQRIKKFKRNTLMHGIIVAQLLEKPRGLKPYRSEEL